MSWLSLVRILAPYLIGIAIGGAAIGYLKQLQINLLDARIAQIGQSLKTTVDANVRCWMTVKGLRDEVTAANGLCATRNRIEANKTDRIQYIDSLSSSWPVVAQAMTKDEVPNEKSNAAIIGGDALFSELSGLFDSGSAGGSAAGIHPAAGTGPADLAEALSCKVADGRHLRLYCLDELSAKNLLKNAALDSAYKDELRTILNSLKQ